MSGILHGVGTTPLTLLEQSREFSSAFVKSSEYITRYTRSFEETLLRDKVNLTKVERNGRYGRTIPKFIIARVSLVQHAIALVLKKSSLSYDALGTQITAK